MGFDDLRRKFFFCDYILKVDDESFVVYKIVMVVCSDYF